MVGHDVRGRHAPGVLHSKTLGPDADPVAERPEVARHDTRGAELQPPRLRMAVEIPA
jgi:hypothetical protein